MPVPLNLTGDRVGKLAVIRRGPRVMFGHEQWGWFCRCDCGTEFIVPQRRLRPGQHAIDACSKCRGHPCVICGAQMTMSSHGNARKACPGECADAFRRKKQNASYHRRAAVDPHLSKRASDRRRERAKVDPAMAAKVKEWERKRRERHSLRMDTDPEYAERFRAQANARYAKDAERIQAERREKLDAMTPEEREAWLVRARRYSRDWRRKWRAELVADPEAHERFKGEVLEYTRQRRAARRQPAPVRTCCVCGTQREDRKFKVLCGNPECLAAYRRDTQYRAKGKKLTADFGRLAAELDFMLQEEETCET